MDNSNNGDVMTYIKIPVSNEVKSIFKAVCSSYSTTPVLYLQDVIAFWVKSYLGENKMFNEQALTGALLFTISQLRPNDTDYVISQLLPEYCDYKDKKNNSIKRMNAVQMLGIRLRYAWEMYIQLGMDKEKFEEWINKLRSIEKGDDQK